MGVGDDARLRARRSKSYKECCACTGIYIPIVFSALDVSRKIGKKVEAATAEYFDSWKIPGGREREEREREGERERGRERAFLKRSKG